MIDCGLTRGLDEAVGADLARACHASLYRVGQWVVSRDDRDCDLFIVLSGRVRVIAYGPSGREVSFRDIGPGEVFGELSALDRRPRSASVVSIEESVIARVIHQEFLVLLQRHWPLCERLMTRLTASVRDMTQRVYELSTLTVRQRLAAELLRLAAGEGGQELVSLPTHLELAARIGTYREQVTRELRWLRDQGLLSAARQGRPGWLITDPGRLAELVDDISAVAGTSAALSGSGSGRSRSPAPGS